MLRRLRLDPYQLLLFALCLPVLAPLFAPGYFYDTHDGRHSVFYLIQFDASLRDGAWWPRWAMHHIQGYGYPTFLIQAPLGLYLAEIFVLLGAGFTLAAKFAWALGVLVGAWGMYALVAHWLRGGTRGEGWEMNRDSDEDWRVDTRHSTLSAVSLAAVAASLLYVYFPYHIVDLYVRGALNDSLLLAWLPWLFLAFDRLILGDATPGWPQRLGLAILCLGGTLLTHTFALLSIAPLLVTFVSFRLGMAWHKGAFPWRAILLAAVGGAGALALSAIFLVPLLAEGRYLQQQVYVTNTYDFRNHFVQIGQFFSPFWGFGFSDDPQGANDGMSFQLGALLAILGIVALLTLHRVRTARPVAIYWLAAGSMLLLIMTPPAQPLWEALPGLAVIQFPWRLLALAGFAFSALGGIVLYNLLPEPIRMAQPAAGLLAIALLGMFASWPYIQANLAPVEPWREDGRAIFRFEQEHPDMIAYTAWVTQPFTTTAMTADYAAPGYKEDHGYTESLTRLEIVSGDGQVLSQESRGSSAGGTVKMRTPGAVKINVFSFPGWSVTVDGRLVEQRVSQPTGAIEIDIPAGEHRIAAHFGTTPPRTLGALISCAVLLAAAALILWPQKED